MLSSGAWNLFPACTISHPKDYSVRFPWSLSDTRCFLFHCFCCCCCCWYHSVRDSWSAELMERWSRAVKWLGERHSPHSGTGARPPSIPSLRHAPRCPPCSLTLRVTRLPTSSCPVLEFLTRLVPKRQSLFSGSRVWPWVFMSL